MQALEQMRAELAARLRTRSAEIEGAIVERVQSLAAPEEAEDAEYRAGVRAAVAEGLDYVLLGFEHGEEWQGRLPAAAAAQARRAARDEVPLDTVLRRYAAGDRVIGEFVMEEAAELPTDLAREIVRANGPHVDRVMAAVAAEYMDELELLRRSPAQRRVEKVQSLLAGSSNVPPSGFDYRFDRWHLGAIVTGSRAEVAARTLAAAAGREPLIVARSEDTAWIWLGGAHLSVDAVERFQRSGGLGDVSLAVGEPRHGLEGWRLTHYEARAAHEVMVRCRRPVTRCSEVVLLAAVARDEVLARSLRQTYLEPLEELGDVGTDLATTVRAYFEAGFNAATAAAALGIDRHTVQRRLRKVEEILGRLLHQCHAEVEVALMLGEFDRARKAETVGYFGKFDDGLRAK